MTALSPLEAAFALKGRRHYDGAAGRTLVACPDCGSDADALFGDHGGDCRPPMSAPRSGAVNRGGNTHGG